MSLRARLGAVARGGAGRSPEVAMRYGPVVRALRAGGGPGPVLEVGSGSLGLAPYWPAPVVGVDRSFSGPPSVLAVAGDVLALPLADRAWPLVACVDVLEHVPPPDRRAAVDELVRVTGRRLVLAVPSGGPAEAHDRSVAAQFRRHHGVQSPFLVDHLAHPLPTATEVRSWVESGLARHGRSARLTTSWHANLSVRRALMGMWARDTLLDRAASAALARAGGLLSRAEGGRRYRLMVVVEMAAP